MSKVNINDKYSPETAHFWAMFATDTGKQKKHCHTVALYQNLDGDFFAVEQAPGGEPMTYEPIKDPQEWLDEYVNKWIKPNLVK